MPVNKTTTAKKNDAFLHTWKSVVWMLIGVVAGWALTNLTETKPYAQISYSTLKRNMLANVTLNPNIIILYHGDTINKVSFVEFSFWNDNDATIDSNTIAPLNGLNIKISDSVKILSVTMNSRSRDNLAFDSLHSTENRITNTIPLRLSNNDGLDFGDGATFDILYAGDTTTAWSLDGRLKNSPNGISRVDPKTIDSLGKTSAVGYIVLSLLIVLSAWGIYRLTKPKYKNDKDFKPRIIILSIVFVGFAFWFYTCAHNQYRYGDRLQWVSKQ